MRQSIFTRPLEEIPAVRKAGLVFYVVFLILFVAFTQFPGLFEPKNWPRIRDVLLQWGLVFALGFGVLSALVSFVFGLLPDCQTPPGHRSCLRWLMVAALLSALGATGISIFRAF